MPQKSHKILRLLLITGVAIFLTIIASIPLRIALTKLHTPQPEAIFMLGGGRDRERFTAEFAQKHPSLPIWISVGSRKAPEIFAKAGINPTRIHYDDRATDTVTNFTTMVEPFQDNHLDHVYLITSDYHMRRSRAIATVVFGSRGIIVTPVAVPSNRETEKNTRIARDVVRSLLWIFTRRTGASLNPSLSWLPNESPSSIFKERLELDAAKFSVRITPHIPVKKPKNPLRLVRWLGWVRVDTVFVK